MSSGASSSSTSLGLRTFDAGAFELSFDLELERIRQLHSVVAEDLHPVVFPGIVGGGYGDRRDGIGGPAEEGDSRCRNDANQTRAPPAGDDARRESAGDPGSRFTGIHAEENQRLRLTRRAEPAGEHFAKRDHRCVVEGEGVGPGADAVGSEEFSHSGLVISGHAAAGSPASVVARLDRLRLDGLDGVDGDEHLNDGRLDDAEPAGSQRSRRLPHGSSRSGRSG
jgi:hypothetical protein